VGNVVLRNNPGYNPVGVITVAVPSSGGGTLQLPYDVTLYITAGSTACTISGVVSGPSIVIPANTMVPVRLPALAWIVH
jgi:hypothetical protein